MIGRIRFFVGGVGTSYSFEFGVEAAPCHHLNCVASTVLNKQSSDSEHGRVLLEVVD